MDKGRLSAGADLLRLSTLGLNFAFCILAGVALGWLLVHYLGAGNWAILAGFLLGVAAGYLLLFEDLKRLNAKNTKKPPHDP